MNAIQQVLKLCLMIKHWFFFLLTLPLWLPAQTVTISEDISLRNDIAYEILGRLKGQTLLFRDKSNEFEIQAFDERMRLSWSKELDLDKKRPEVIGLVPDKDRFTLLYAFRQKGDLIIKAHRYDPGANMTDSATIKNLGYLIFSPKLEMIYSENRKKALVYYVERETEYHAYMFDLDYMKLLWEGDLKLERFTFEDDYEQLVVNDNGDVFVVLGRNNSWSKREDPRYEVHVFDGNSGQLRQFDVFFGEHLTYDAMFTYDNTHHQLVGAGLYSERNRARAPGYFYLRIDPINPAAPDLQFHELDEEYVSNIMGKVNDGSKGLAECVIQDIALRQDGGAVIIGERNRVYERRMSGPVRGFYDRTVARAIVDYYLDDLFILSVHPDGTSHWQSICHKKQYSQDDGAIFSSYLLAKTPRKLRLVFNDEIKNDNIVSEYLIGSNGNLDRNAVMSTENQQLKLRFRDGVQITGNEIIVPSERRNRLKLVLVHF